MVGDSQENKIPGEEKVAFDDGNAVDDAGNSPYACNDDCVKTLNVVVMVDLETMSVDPANRDGQHELKKANYGASDDGKHDSCETFECRTSLRFGKRV